MSHKQQKLNCQLEEALARGRQTRLTLAQAEGGSISATEVAQWLRITEATVRRRYQVGRLLAWRDEQTGELCFPGWQFRGASLLPGIEPVLAVLHTPRILDDWGKVLFFLGRCHSLDGRRPLDLLRAGELEPVLRNAHAYIDR